MAEPYELRGSCTVLRKRRDEIPRRYSPRLVPRDPLNQMAKQITEKRERMSEPGWVGFLYQMRGTGCLLSCGRKHRLAGAQRERSELDGRENEG